MVYVWSALKYWPQDPSPAFSYDTTHWTDRAKALAAGALGEKGSARRKH